MRGDELDPGPTARRRSGLGLALVVIAVLALFAGGAWIATHHQVTVQPPDASVFSRAAAPDGVEVAIAVLRDFAGNEGELRRVEPGGRIAWRHLVPHVHGPVALFDDHVVVRLSVEDLHGPILLRSYALGTGALEWEASDDWPVPYAEPHLVRVADDGLFTLVRGESFDTGEAGGSLARMRSLATGAVTFDVRGPAHAAYEHLEARVFDGHVFVDGDRGAAISEIDRTGSIHAVSAQDAVASCVTPTDLGTLTTDGTVWVRPLSGGEPTIVTHARRGRLACGRDGARLYVSWGDGGEAHDEVIGPLADPSAVPEAIHGALFVVEEGRVVATLGTSWGSPRMHFARPSDEHPSWSPERDGGGRLRVHVVADPEFIGEEAGFEDGVDVGLTVDATTLAVLSRDAEVPYPYGAPDP